MRFVIDFLLLLAATVAIATVSLKGAFFILLVGLAFGVQYWKTKLLVGTRAPVQKKSLHFMAALASIALTAAIGLAIQAEPTAAEARGFEELFPADLLPLFIVVSLLASVAMCGIISERRRR